MAGIKIHKIQSASLLEVLVATVIIMTVVSIGTIISLNVINSSYTFQKVNAGFMLQEVSVDTKVNKTLFDEEIEKDNILISKRVDKYKETSNLFLLDLKAFSHEQKLLSERKELILVSDE